MNRKSSFWANLPASDRFILKMGMWMHKSLEDAHSLWKSLPGILLGSIFLGAVTAFQYNHWLPFTEILRLGIESGLFVIGIPYLLGIIISVLLNRKRMVPKKLSRSEVVFTSAVAFWFFGIAIIFGNMFARFSPLSPDDVLTLAGASSFAAAFLGFLLSTEDFKTSLTLSLPITIPVLGIAFFNPNPVFPMPSIETFIIQALLLYSVILFNMGLVFFAIDQVSRNELGIGGMESINILIGLISGKKKAFENALEAVGRDAKTFLGLLEFKCKGKNVLWVVPGVHPGPFANVGGSDLPLRLQNAFPEKKVFCFHGPSNHDLNPTSSKEIKILISEIEKRLKEMDFSSSASEMRREIGKEIVLDGQSFGGRPLYIGYRYLGTSEDMDASIGGVVAMKKESPILIDGHNRLEDSAFHNFWELGSGGYMEGSIRYGDAASFEIVSLTDKIELKDENKFSIGVGKELIGSEEEGIGAMGIQVAVIEVGEQRSAYVLIDGNNAEAGLREAIENRLSGLVDIAVVATTDNHSVNSIMSDLNPVGAILEHQQIVDACFRAAISAIDDLEPAKVATSMEILSGMNFLGAGRSEQIIASARAFFTVTKIILPGAILGLLALALVSVMAI